MREDEIKIENDEYEVIIIPRGKIIKSKTIHLFEYFMVFW